jgi:hypothetical protein
MSAAKEKTKSRFAHLAPVKAIINRAPAWKGGRPIAGNGPAVRVLGTNSLRKLALKIKRSNRA